MPGEQAVHTRSLAALPAVVTDVPAAQADHAMQLVAFGSEVKVPSAHAAHCWSDVDVPAAITDVPAAQEDHVVQVAWFGESL